MGARLACNQNAAIFDDFWQSRTPTYYTYFKREFDKKGVNIGVLAGFVLLLSGMHAVFMILHYFFYARFVKFMTIYSIIIPFIGA